MNRKSIDDLSNLVFGLALTIGAVTLVAPAHDDLAELLAVLVRFALSFFIIVFVWWIYNDLSNELDLTKGNRVVLNFAILFLVVIEPYLLTIIDTEAGAVAYAFDLGSTLLILYYFAHQVHYELLDVDEEAKLVARVRRDLILVRAAIFYLTIVPIIVLPMPQGINVAGVIWILLLIVPTRLLVRLRQHSMKG